MCGWLARVFAVRRPSNCLGCGSAKTRPTKKRKRPWNSPQKNINSAKELMQQNSSRSLLANVLDLDDDFLLFNITGMKTYAGCSALQATNHLDAWATDRRISAPDSTVNRSDPEDTNCIWQRLTQAKHTMSDNRGNGATDAGDVVATECSLLIDVLREVRFLTERIHSEGVRLEICNEWKFAAMVIDRVCLWMFTVISTGAILCSAPHAIY